MPATNTNSIADHLPVRRKAISLVHPGGGAAVDLIPAAGARTTTVVVSLALFMTGEAVDVHFEDAAENEIFGGDDAPIKLGPDQVTGFILSRNADGWMATAPGQSLKIVASGACTFAGSVLYVEA